MHWYYESGGQQIGPLTDEQFRAEVKKGKVSQETLVWNESLNEWTNYGSLGSAPPPMIKTTAPQVAFSPVMQKCSQCSRALPQQEMIQYGNLWVCANCKATFFQRLKEEGRVSALWRDGKLLVAARDTVLPDRCVKCNRPARGLRMTRKLYWHSPIIYLLICGGFLLYLIVALIVRKSATITLGICEEHRQKRRRSIAIAWSIVGLAIGLFFLAAILDEGAIAGLGVVVLLGGIIFGLITAQLVTPTKIDDQGMVWLRGIPPAYLDGLPTYQRL